jgi:DNA-binding NarL/FixJ family response regulator
MIAKRASVRSGRVIEAVEAAYSLEGTDEAWLRRILDVTAHDLDLGVGTYAFTARHGADRIQPDSEFVPRDLDPAYYGMLSEINRTAPTELLDELAKSLVRCGGLEHALGRDHALVRHFRSYGAPIGIVDGFTMYAHDGESAGFVMAAPARRFVRPGPAMLDIWHRAALHFATALRLRRKLRAGDGQCVAILTGDGDVADATDHEIRTQRDARDRLRAEVRRIERARSRAYRRDPARALALWRGLIDGRWSLVDRWESDSRRYIAVHRNAPDHADPRALDPRERTVAHYLGLGASNKEIAFALGLPMGSVPALVRNTVRKLGGRHRSDVIGFAEGTTLSVRLGAENVDVLQSHMHADHPSLTPEERAILPYLVRGASNAEIARARGTREKTVANQLYAIYAKLGGGSRAAIVAKITRQRAGAP